MAEPIPENRPADTPPKPRGGGLRRILRLVRSALLTLLLLAVAGLAMVIHRLTDVSVWIVQRLLPGAEVHAEQVHLEDLSTLNVDQLEIRYDGRPAIAVDSLQIGFSYGDLLSRNIDTVRIVGPVLTITPALQGLLPKAPRAADGGGNWSVDRFSIRSGTLVFREFGEKLPTASANFSLTIEDLGGKATAPLQLALEDLLVVPEAGEPTPLVQAESIALRADLAHAGTGRIDSLTIDGAAIGLTPALLELLGDRPAAPGATEPMPWAIGELAIRDLSLDASGFEGVEEARVSISVHGTGIGSDSNEPVHVQLEDLEFQTEETEATPPSRIRIPLAEIAFVPTGLAEARLRSIRIAEPELFLTPALGALTGPAAGPQNPEASAVPPWAVEALEVTGGSLEIAGLDAPLPGARTGFSLSGENLTAAGRQPLQVALSNLQVGAGENSQAPPIARLDTLAMELIPADLVEREIASLKLTDGALHMGAAFRSLFEPPPETAPENQPPPRPIKAWRIRTLDLENIRASLGDLGEGIPDITFRLDSTMRDIAIGEAEQRIAQVEHEIELSNIDLVSPLDPFVKVLTLRSVFVRFSLAGFLRNEIAGITILNPTLYVSEDLFWYMDYFAPEGEEDPAAAEAGSAPGWRVDELNVYFGKLVIAAGGRTRVGLPLGFQTEVRNLSFDSLAGLQLNASLDVPEQSFRFPGYELELDKVSGELLLAYPPEEEKNNLVQVLRIPEIRWRQYDATDAWVSVTFDEQGVNGQFGAEAYRGYLDGGFTFLFADDFPWIAWIAGTGVRMNPLTRILAPENIRITGPADFKLQANARTRHLERMIGTIDFTEAGMLEITKLNEMLAEMPPEWGITKQSLTRIGIETLRDFAYTDGLGSFWFAENQGALELRLEGPTGARNFTVQLHPPGNQPAPWTLEPPPGEPTGD